MSSDKKKQRKSESAGTRMLSGNQGLDEEAKLRSTVESQASDQGFDIEYEESTGDDLGDETQRRLVSGESDRGGLTPDDAARSVLPELRSLLDTQPGTRKVHDGDQRIRINRQSITKYPYRAVCLLIMRRGGQMAMGTGWLAGPDLLVTAGHNLFANDVLKNGWVEQVEVYASRDGDVFFAMDVITKRKQMLVSDAWLNQTQERDLLDYGAIRLNKRWGDDLGWFQLEAWKASALRSKALKVNLVGYPTHNEVEGQQIPKFTMWGQIGKISFVGEKTLRYRIDSTGGQSGSPIIAWSADSTKGFVCVGIHNKGGSSDNQATRVTPSVLDAIAELR